MFGRRTTREEPVNAQPAAGHGVPASRPVPAATYRQPVGGLAVRLILTILGATGMIVGAFLAWVRGVAGTNLTLRGLWSTNFSHRGNLILTAGFVMIVLGLVALIGMAPKPGWLTRLAGTLAIVEFALLIIQVYRAPDTSIPGSLGAGLWLGLVGGIAALIGGFFGSRPEIMVLPPSPTIATGTGYA